MPGYVLHLGATITCSHPPGPAQPVTSVPRVKVGGQAVVVETAQYAITGCALELTSSTFCTTAQWLTGATRVQVLKTPALLQDSRSMSPQTGAPLQVMVTQVRVKGI